MASHFSFLHLLPPFYRSLFFCDFSTAALFRSVMLFGLFSLFMAKDILYRSSLRVFQLDGKLRWIVGTHRDQLMSRVTSTILWHAATRRERRGGLRKGLHIHLRLSYPLPYSCETIPYMERVKELILLY